MPVVRDIAATYRKPRRVMRRLLDMGPREDRALAILMAGCLIMFIAQWPRLSAEAHRTGEALNPLLGASLMAWLFIMPLVFYLVAAFSWGVLRLLAALRLVRCKPGGYATRIALFWAFLASCPLILLHGLVAGFIGTGPALQGVGALWLVVFLWFWLSSLREAGWSSG